MKTLHWEYELQNENIIQHPILDNGNGWTSTEDQMLSVIESGDKIIMLSEILNIISKAKKLICLQSFLIQDGALINALVTAVNSGVRVFILSSVEARLSDRIEEEPDFIKNSYVEMLENKFKYHFVHRSAENFHAKYIIIDPGAESSGYILTNNFTINGFKNNPELAVNLNVDQCNELFKVFVYHFWEHATDEQTETREFAKIKPIEKFKLPKLKHILFTSPETTYNTLNIELIEKVRVADKSITLSTFQIDTEIELVKEIYEKAVNGVSVTIFCRPIEKQFNEQLKKLINVGVKVYMHPLMHAKSLLVDNKFGYVFTANFTTKGLDQGLEVGVKLNNHQTTDLSIIHNNWEKTFPFYAPNSRMIYEIEDYYVFDNHKFLKKTLQTKEVQVKKRITTVRDLQSLFIQNKSINDSSVKLLKIKFIAEIDDCPDKYYNQNLEKYHLFENKENEERFVVLSDKFEMSDLSSLIGYEDCKVFIQS